MQLHKLVENSYESAYCKMINDTEMQDAKEEWIESRVQELIRNSPDECNDEIESIYLEQAKTEFNKRFKGGLNHDQHY